MAYGIPALNYADHYKPHRSSHSWMLGLCEHSFDLHDHVYLNLQALPSPLFEPYL
jgi:hypothetical protein